MFEEQPSVVLVRTAGNLWPDFGCIFHITTSLSFIISFQRVAERCCQIKCSEETVEWRSVTLLGRDGTEPLAITKPSLPSRFVTIHCTLTLGTMLTLPSDGWQIWNAARRLWVVNFTPSQFLGKGGRNDFLIGQRVFVVFLLPYGEIRERSICCIFHQNLGKRIELTMLRFPFYIVR